MNDAYDSKYSDFGLFHAFYALTLFGCGLATFGEIGIVFAAAICVFWGSIFSSRSRRRTLARVCLFLLIAFFLLGGLTVALAYSPRSAVRRMVCSNNLRQIAIALHNYHDTYGSLPPAYLVDSDGRPTHSWRVLVLPFLEEEKLYQQYSFNEPWNGPNNRKLLDRMPRIYACPSALAQGKPTYNNTSYVAVVGATTAWPGAFGRTFSEIPDGTSNTALVIEHNNSTIPWLEPRDLLIEDALSTVPAGSTEFVGNHRWESFFYEYAGGRQIVLGDGSAQYVSLGVKRSVWAALFEVDDGVRIDHEDLSVPEAVHRRLQWAHVIGLTFFVLLAMCPLPWVWLNPTSTR